MYQIDHIQWHSLLVFSYFIPCSNIFLESKFLSFTEVGGTYTQKERKTAGQLYQHLKIVFLTTCNLQSRNPNLDYKRNYGALELKLGLSLLKSSNTTQLTFTCLKSIIETIEKRKRYVQS